MALLFSFGTVAARGHIRVLALLVLCVMLPALPMGAATISGIVVRADGAAIEGARVYMNQDRRVRDMTTGGKGTFRFEEVAVGPMEVVAYHPDFAMDGFTTVPVDDLEVNLVLTEPAGIAIRVINNEFMPVPGARITGMVVNDRFAVSVEDLAEKGFPMLRSDDSGFLDITCIPAGGFIKMTLAHHDYAYSDVAYLPEDSRRRDIVLYPGTRLRGRVTAEKKPVQNARISVFQKGVSGQRKFAEALTDGEGFYHLRAPEDHYLVAVRHPDYASPTPMVADMTRREETAVLDIELKPPYIIRGSIVFPDGKPCPGARLLFRIEDTIFEDTFSDVRGRFTLRSGSGDGVLRVVPPPGYMTKILAEIPVALGEVREVDLKPIKLVRLPLIRGRGILPKDAEPARLYVRSLNLPAPIHVLTDDSGVFEIQLFYQPEQKTIAFRIEHPLRFLHRDFTVDLEKPGKVEVVLEEFEPRLEKTPYQPGRNNLTPLIDKAAPPIKCAEWFNSPPLALSDLKGKVVVLTLWAGFDTSHFALNRLTELRIIHELFGSGGDVAVIGVHDAGSEPDEVEQYLERYAITFPVGRDADPYVSFNNYGVNAIPQTVLIDKKGILRYAETEDRLLELIKALRRRS